MTEAAIGNEIAVQDAETLGALRRRAWMLVAFVLPAIILTVVLVISEARPQRVGDFAASAIPRVLMSGGQSAGTGAGGVWTSTDMHFTDVEMQILETSDYVYRTYTDGKGAPVDLCIVFSEDNRKGTHPPDICLEGSGYRIVSRTSREVVIEHSRLTLAEIVASAGPGVGANQYVYFAYFYKCGDTFTPSFYQQQMAIVWNGLTRRNAAGRWCGIRRTWRRWAIWRRLGRGRMNC